MIKRMSVALFFFLFVFSTISAAAAEIEGVTFPAEKEIKGKTLSLNGTALRKKFVFIKVYAGGFYLENPTQNAEKAIMSEQVKYFYLHYLTNKATAEKIQHGFIEAMKKANPADLFKKHRDDIERYASWLDEDMKVGSTSESVYVPGEGLTLMLNGKTKGTIKGREFARMYYRYNLGEKADENVRKGYLGL